MFRSMNKISCWTQLLRWSVEIICSNQVLRLSIEICCWDFLLKSTVEIICWDYLSRSADEIFCPLVEIKYLLRPAVESICWDQLLSLPVEICCWDFLLTSADQPINNTTNPPSNQPTKTLRRASKTQAKPKKNAHLAPNGWHGCWNNENTHRAIKNTKTKRNK